MPFLGYSARSVVACIYRFSGFWIVLAGLLLSMALPGQVTGATGRVSGRVLDDSGRPLRNAAVTLHAVGAEKPVTLTSAANGVFEGAAIVPGTYRVCVRGAEGALALDPCLWAAFAPEVFVRAGQTTVLADVVLETGTVLEIRIVDVAKQLTRRPAPGLQMAGIWTDKSVFFPLRGEAAQDGVTSYRMLVPFERDLTFSAGGAPVSYQIAGKSAEAKQGLKEKIRLAKPAGPSQTVTLTVTGAVAP